MTKKSVHTSIEAINKTKVELKAKNYWQFRIRKGPTTRI